MNGLHTYDLMIRPVMRLAIALTVTGFAYAGDGPSAFPVASTPKPLTPLMQRELRGCFDFFWKEWISDSASPTYGMTAGDYVGMRLYSPRVELSNASSGTMVLGALAAGEYFGGQVKRLAEELYADMNWKWFTNPVTKHPYLACYPRQRPKKVPADITKEGMFGAWAAYAEHIFLYILAAGAPRPDFATGADSNYAMMTFKGRYKGEEFIFCGTGAAFTYQWTHAFIDFRNMRDKLGRNWFDNSRRAALAARQYAIDNADRIKGLGPNSWGMSASISPSTGYSGHYGSHPISAGHKLLEDGTVAPYGSLSFLPFTDAAVDFIKRHKDEPFFCYVPHSAVHYPFMVTPKELAAAGNDAMTALISKMDNSTGRILQTLRDLGIAENTLVLFTNDNGGGGKTSPGPLRGAKFGPKYEGHMRVATLAWWPGRIPAGSVSSEIMTRTDLLPTIAKLTGQRVPADRIVDGKDVSDILLGKPDAKSPHEILYYEKDGIRQGKWKLVRYRVKADRLTELYDLEADLGEKNNIADQNPDKVKAMKAVLDAHVAEIELNSRPAAFVKNPRPILSDPAGLPTLAEYVGKSPDAKTTTKPAVKAPVRRKKPVFLVTPGPNRPPSREIKITGKHLLLPIAPRKAPDGSDNPGNSFRILVDGVLVHQFWACLPRSDAEIEFWSYVDMSEFVGKTATVILVRGPHEGAEQVLERFESSDEIRALKPFYTEQGRPQFHFSQKVGWNNDVNGMVYSDGLYHLAWQCNPVGRQWNNMYWGHAVSKDLVHWEQWPRMIRVGGAVAKGEPIHPSMSLGPAFSGSACVDHNNTLGKQIGDTKTLIACFTDVGGGDQSQAGEGEKFVGESLAYSTDNGRTYQLLRDFNPIISHRGRDPKLFWYEPGQHWCIVAYRAAKKLEKGRPPTGKMAFYISKDLKDWTFASFSDDVFHECPDFVELPVDGDPQNKKWLLFDATPKYQIGSFDGRQFTPEFEGTRQTIGGTLKAAQCFSNAPYGRAICMAWARVKPQDPQAPYNQGFTLPLELSLRTATCGVRCYANPVKELVALRQSELASVQTKAVEGETRIPLEKPATLLEIELSLRYENGNRPDRVALQVGEHWITYDVANETFPNARLASYDKEDGTLDLRVFVDSSTVEVFGEHGAVYYLQPRRVQGESVKELFVKVEGGAASVDNLKVYTLKSIWQLDLIADMNQELLQEDRNGWNN